MVASHAKAQGKSAKGKRAIATRKCTRWRRYTSLSDESIEFRKGESKEEREAKCPKISAEMTPHLRPEVSLRHARAAREALTLAHCE